ncbi:ABC transporter ATP-binding protein [Nitratireductor sp. StC3]|uniref:ABC transporter ATP-binding protein n=1 Tax=Nitratireductor sp. StC3 TaxID=2126741 RepID=UPI000D0E2387|nr:ABC transporter ATP-binding protein [Nitratireductor sp. StC3]PSM15806.1 ABC transporter [Nitratireductor sp. StC3]
MRSDDRKTAPLLEIRNLHVDGGTDQGSVSIIKGVSLAVGRGEMLGLVGESGAGKSTLGLAAMGYARRNCRLSKGAVLFDGVDLVTAGREARRRLRGARVTYIAQSAAASFNPARRLMVQTIEATVRHGLRSRYDAMRDAVDLFEKMNLPEPHKIGQRYPHQVSGGQLQRIMTAAAVSSRPDLIVFDEPTTALDVTTQVEVLATMRDIVRRLDIAGIYITHDLAVVAQMADRIAVLRHGELVEEAPTRRMLSAPQAEYTRSLWSVRELHKPENPGGKPVLRVAGLSAAYASARVLDDVTIEVPRGRTVALVGESGSGKSTLGRVISGLLPPVAGTMEFEGTSLAPRLRNRPMSQVRRIQMIYQMADTAMNPRQPVHEIIGRPMARFLGMNRRQRRERTLELLDLIELGAEVHDRYPDELSGGQKQRICIARALAAEPSLIICDEVTSALDQLVQDSILRLLLRLQEELGLSYLFITHDIDTVRAIADRVVVLHRGRIVEQGLKSEVLSPPHPPYTDLLLSSVPQMEPDWLSGVLARRAD